MYLLNPSQEQDVTQDQLVSYQNCYHPWLAADESKVSHVLSHIVWWKKMYSPNPPEEQDVTQD